MDDVLGVDVLQRLEEGGHVATCLTDGQLNKIILEEKEFLKKNPHHVESVTHQ